MSRRATLFALLVCACSAGPDDQVLEGACQIADPAAPPDYLESFTCFDDFNSLGSLPVDATLPSATSVKVVLDQFDSDHLYFQNTQKYRACQRF